ncbi:MAG: signal peptidase II [Spirochaetaceae bacterium]|nr:signal peptidase II [Spirochaetaceae bacterium]
MKLLQGRGRFIIMTAVIFLANYSLDRITKQLALKYLSGREPIRLLNDLLIFRYAENTGAFLSMGTDWNVYVKYLLLLIIPIIICIIGILHLMFREGKVYRVAIISCIIGGGIGNLADRLFNEFRVIDFINVGIGNLRTGILNVADLSVTFGCIVLLVFEGLESSRARKVDT